MFSSFDRKYFNLSTDVSKFCSRMLYNYCLLVNENLSIFYNFCQFEWWIYFPLRLFLPTSINQLPRSMVRREGRSILMMSFTPLSEIKFAAIINSFKFGNCILVMMSVNPIPNDFWEITIFSHSLLTPYLFLKA